MVQGKSCLFVRRESESFFSLSPLRTDTNNEYSCSQTITLEKRFQQEGIRFFKRKKENFFEESYYKIIPLEKKNSINYFFPN
jgi:hypothetical protein